LIVLNVLGIFSQIGFLGFAVKPYIQLHSLLNDDIVTSIGFFVRLYSCCLAFWFCFFSFLRLLLVSFLLDCLFSFLVFGFSSALFDWMVGESVFASFSDAALHRCCWSLPCRRSGIRCLLSSSVEWLMFPHFSFCGRRRLGCLAARGVFSFFRRGWSGQLVFYDLLH
jgi:hypothetical protein